MDISQIVGKRNVSQSDFQAFHDAYYRWIAENKIDIQTLSGLKVDRSDLHPRLFEYQKDAVLWALRIGHGLLAERFGLGKTTQQIEILRQVHQQVGGAQLVICPLGVRQQFTHEDGPAIGALRERLAAEWTAERNTPPPESQGIRIVNALNQAGVKAMLFDWPDAAPVKAGIDWLLLSI